MKHFALIGAAGYIAPRHMKAIKETGNNLVAVLDKNDSVGILDRFFPEADFFTEFERFDRHIDLIKRQGRKVDYVSIASPNYLHDSHIRFALRSGAHAICEKPLVLTPKNIDGLEILEKETGRKVYNILQLRLHRSIIALKEEIERSLSENPNKIFNVDLTYITSRGHWYFTSWKGEEAKSGGIATNIGVHFYDMLAWIFGDLKENRVYLRQKASASGCLEFSSARVRWFLSADYDHIPEVVKAQGQRTYRSIVIDGNEVEFSGGFSDLHTTSYERILSGNGFPLQESRKAIEIVTAIRNAEILPLTGDYHPLVLKK